jgi:hypothetical protein
MTAEVTTLSRDPTKGPIGPWPLGTVKQ